MKIETIVIKEIVYKKFFPKKYGCYYLFLGVRQFGCDLICAGKDDRLIAWWHVLQDSTIKKDNQIFTTLKFEINKNCSQKALKYMQEYYKNLPPLGVNKFCQVVNLEDMKRLWCDYE